MGEVEHRMEYYPDGELLEESEFVNGFRHGKRIIYFKSGARRIEDNFVMGMREGEAQIFYESGAVRWRAVFYRGLIRGKEYCYHENGQLRKVTEYDDGLVIDSEIPVYDENGKHYATEVWEDGYRRVYSTDGEILCEGALVNRAYFGLHKFYYDDGSLKLEEYYRKGRLHGLSRKYNSDGTLSSETPFVDGLREGVGKFYDHERGVVSEFPFHNDKVNGLVRMYREGQLFAETPYENGARQGYAQFYNPDGSIFKKLMYVDNEYCGGELLEYEDGALSRECDISYERPEGEEINYNANGTIRMKIMYKNGMVVDGKYKFFEEDGSLGGHIVFKNNRAIERDVKGKLRATYDLYRDEWNGRCVIYDAEVGETECYFMGNEHFDTREEFLDATFERMAEVCYARFAKKHPEFTEDTYKVFFAEAYEKAMESPAAQVEYTDYAELKNPGPGGISDEQFADYVVREFVLRLRLPNDGETEREIVKGLRELL